MKIAKIACQVERGDLPLAIVEHFLSTTHALQDNRTKIDPHFCGDNRFTGANG